MKKKILFLVFLLFSTFAFAQIENFQKAKIDDYFGGMNSNDFGDKIAINQGTFVQNAVIKNKGQIFTRTGQALFNSENGATAFDGINRFDPDTSNSYLVVASGTTVVSSLPTATTWTQIAPSTALTAGNPATFIQANNLFFVLNGVNKTSWYNGTTWTTGGTWPGNASPPTATTAAWLNNYLFLAGNSTNTDWLYVSDNLTPQAFTATQVIKINSGDGQGIKRVEPYRTGDIIIYKERSIYDLDITGVDSSCSPQPICQWKVTKLAGDVGTPAPRSVVSLGNDQWFLSSNPYAIRSLQRTQFDKTFVNLMSKPIQDILDGTGSLVINEVQIDKAAAVYFDNKYLIAIPTGSSSVNNTVLVYDFITESWLIYDGWYPSGWVVYNNGLYYTDANTGRVVQCLTGTTGDLGTTYSDGTTRLLLHMEGSDGAAIFPDASGHTVTATFASTSTVVAKIGNASGNFTSGKGYLTSADSSDWNIGNNYTMEGWFNFSNLANRQDLITQYQSAGAMWSMYKSSTALGNKIGFTTADTNFDTYTKLITHFDGASGARVYVAETGQTVTFAGTTDSLDTNTKKFGASSLWLDGNSDFVTVPHSADWDFGSGDFTIDFWFKLNANQTSTYLSQTANGTSDNAWLISYAGGELYFQYSTNGTSFVNKTVSWTYDTSWHHYAVVRNGNNLYFFIDGSQVGATQDVTGVTIFNSGNTLAIGQTGYGSQWVNGNIDEIRISKGIARWVTTFIPDTTPYGTKADYIMTNAWSGLATGAWHHIATVLDTVRANIYIDGVLQPITENKALESTGDITGNLYIGQSGASTNYLNGYADEVRLSKASIYTSEFTPSTDAFSVNISTYNPIEFSYTSKILDFDNPENFKQLDSLGLEFYPTGSYSADVYLNLDNNGFQFAGSIPLTANAVTLPVNLPFTLASEGITYKTLQLTKFGEFKKIQVKVELSGESEKVILQKLIIYSRIKPWRRE